MTIPQKIVIVSSNAGKSMGGEAIKAYQFFLELSAKHSDVILITHARCRDQLAELIGRYDVNLIEDDKIMLLLWRSRFLRFLVDTYFHLQVRRMLPLVCERNQNNIVHYLCPISPVTLRFPIAGYRSFLGPINGNLSYPPAFAQREGLKARLTTKMQGLIQRFIKFFSPEKKRFEKILVSGYSRTRVSLKLAGAEDRQLINVVDSGISAALSNAKPIVHSGYSGRFLCSGRFVDYKGMDLAIRAVAQAPLVESLDIFGDGPKAAAWKALAEELGIENRVNFCGWCPHDELMSRMRNYRAYVFPSLAEANGIVMQEAMTIGLPVISLRWGGPTGLADNNSAIFIEPKSESYVVRSLACAMSKFAQDPNAANEFARNARKTALENFLWQDVVHAWTKYY